MSNEETKEILEAIQTFATSVDQRFELIAHELHDFRNETNERFEKVNERIDKLYSLVDGFIALHQKLDIELTSLRSSYQRLEERIAKLEAKPA